MGSSHPYIRSKEDGNVYQPSHNERAFNNVIQILGQRPDSVVAIFGASDHFPDSKQYWRACGDYLFGVSVDGWRISYVTVTLRGMPIEFTKQNILSSIKDLGFAFPNGCRTDTTFGYDPKYKYLNYVEISYLDCLAIQALKPYEDTGKYFCRLILTSRGGELGADLYKVSAVLSTKSRSQATHFLVLIGSRVPAIDTVATVSI